MRPRTGTRTGTGTGFFFVTEADRRRRQGGTRSVAGVRCPPGFVWNRPQQACLVVRGSRMYGMAGAALSGACPNETAKVIGAGIGGAILPHLLGTSPFSLVGAAVTIPGALIGASIASVIAGGAQTRWPRAFEGHRGLRGAGLRGSRNLRGDLMRCVQYARTPRGKVRCVTMSPGPGAPDNDARDDAGITGRYRYQTSRSPTRGEKQARKKGIARYPRVHRSDDERRVRPGRNVPVPVPGGRAQGRAQRRAA